MMQYVQNQNQTNETGVYYHSYFCLEAMSEIKQPGSLLRSSTLTYHCNKKNIFLSLWHCIPAATPLT